MMIIITDWGATHSTSIVQGLDQEMPSDDYFGKSLKKMVDDGKINESYVEDSTYRVLLPMFRVGLFDDVNNNKITNNVTSQ